MGTQMNSTPWLAIATFVLAILKLTGTITLSWWWVFAPMLLGLGILLVVILCAVAWGIIGD